jgi:hypothetical protein
MDIIVVFALKIISKPNLGGPIHNRGIRCMETSSFELSKCAKLSRWDMVYLSTNKVKFAELI